MEPKLWVASLFSSSIASVLPSHKGHIPRLRLKSVLHEELEAARQKSEELSSIGIIVREDNPLTTPWFPDSCILSKG